VRAILLLLAQLVTIGGVLYATGPTLQTGMVVPALTAFVAAAATFGAAGACWYPRRRSGGQGGMPASNPPPTPPRRCDRAQARCPS
jgi:hypothetical protein